MALFYFSSRLSRSTRFRTELTLLSLDELSPLVALFSSLLDGTFGSISSLVAPSSRLALWTLTLTTHEDQKKGRRKRERESDTEGGKSREARRGIVEKQSKAEMGRISKRKTEAKANEQRESNDKREMKTVKS